MTIIPSAGMAIAWRNIEVFSMFHSLSKDGGSKRRRHHPKPGPRLDPSRSAGTLRKWVPLASREVPGSPYAGRSVAMVTCGQLSPLKFSRTRWVYCS
jgi:hypothetical protein